MNCMIQTHMPDMAQTGCMPRSRVLGAYGHEARAECLRYLRNPGFMLPMLLFPAVFYFLFGVLLARYNGADAARLFLANYATFGVMGPGLFGFGVALALERDGGLLDLKRALPMPPGAYLLGKMVMAMLGAATIVLILITMAVFLAKAPLASTQMLALLATGVAGAVPFCAIGLCLGTLIKGHGAPGLINLIYLPMAFLSGLWFPLAMMPGMLRQAAPIWPSYHLDQLALAAVGLPHANLSIAVLVLVAYSAACFGLATRRLRRNG